MPDPKEPIDPEVIAMMLTEPEFNRRSAAELIYLIQTGLDILHHQELIKNGQKVKWAHYHLPVNHKEALLAAEQYRYMKKLNA